MGSSDLTLNQLFRYGHSMYGLQFHLEMTPDLLGEMVEDSRDDLAEVGVDADPMMKSLRRGRESPASTARCGAVRVFARWAGLCKPATPAKAQL